MSCGETEASSARKLMSAPLAPAAPATAQAPSPLPNAPTPPAPSEEDAAGLPAHLECVLRIPRSPRKATWATSLDEHDESSEAERIRRGLSSLISQGEDGISLTIPFRSSQPTLSYRSRECGPEAREYMTQNLLQSGVPLWYALLLGRKIGLEMYPPLPWSSASSEAESDGEEVAAGPADSAASLSAARPAPSASPQRNNIPKRADALLATFVEEILKLGDAELVSQRPAALRPYSVYAAKNQRRKMEDRHVVVPQLSLTHPDAASPRDEYYAVFDGHGGAEVAGYLATHLLDHLVHSPAFPSDPEEAFRQAYASCDKALIRRAERTNYRGGATSVTALMRSGRLHVAWAGDSQAALVRLSAPPLLLTDPVHSPHTDSEFLRVEAAGGAIVSMEGELRVQGCLNLTRSFGDLALKPSVVIATPDVASVDLSPDDVAVVLGCDGFFDHVGLEEILPLVRAHAAAKDPASFSGLAKVLGEAAKANGSSDNISIVLCLLCSPEELWRRLKESPES